MFTRRCTACERRQLVFPSQLTGLEATDLGLRVSYTCMCGEAQTFTAEDAAQVVPRVAA